MDWTIVAQYREKWRTAVKICHCTWLWSLFKIVRNEFMNAEKELNEIKKDILV